MGVTQRLGTIPLAIQTDSSNNVGIGGAANASYKLAVTGASLFTGAATFGTGTSAYTFGGGSAAAGGLTDKDLTLKAWSPSGGTNEYGGNLILSAGVGTGNTSGKLGSVVINVGTEGATSSTLGTLTTIATFTKNGLGIGTSTPATNLQISIPSSQSNGEALRLVSKDSIGDCYQTWFRSDNTTRKGYFGYGYTSQDNLELNQEENAPILIYTNATERMRITAGGTLQQTIPNSNDGLFHQIPANSYTGYIYSYVVNNGGSYYLGIERSTGSGLCNGASAYATVLTTNNATNLSFGTNGTERMRIYQDGYIHLNSVVFGTTTSGTVRTLYIGNGANYLIGGISSILASKKNIEGISNVDWIYQLNPVTFNYRKKDEKGNYTEEIYEDLNYGLIAEDTAPIADFLINYNDKEDGTKEMVGIEYPRLITPLLKAIQDQKKLIDELSAKVTALENK